jgi:hypothetical protein
VAAKRASARSEFVLPFGLSLALVSLAGAGGCQGWEGDVIVAGDKPVDTSSLLVCPPETLQIRLLFSDGRLATYQPDAVTPLTDLVQLSCGATGSAGQPQPSFAVDRHGDVWVADGNGALYKVRRGMGACMTTGFSTSNAGGPFRMAFVADAAAPDKETLYVAIGTDRTPAGMPRTAELAPLSFSASGLVLGKRVKLPGWPILSGTGDPSTGNGRLWGLFPATATTAAYAAEIDPRTGALGTKMYSAPNVLGPQRSSFVIWRGDFWVFPGRTEDPAVVEWDSEAAPYNPGELPGVSEPPPAETAKLGEPPVAAAPDLSSLLAPRNVYLARLTVPATGLQSEVVSAAVSTCATGR